MNGFKENQIRPIQTLYKGYKFRSRLEARWAIFFEQLKVNFEYEAEGYENPTPRHPRSQELIEGLAKASGKPKPPKKKPEYWLPDFWLPDKDILVEIKPITFKETLERDYWFFVRFATFLDKHIFLIIGTPSPGGYCIVWFRKGTGLAEGGEWEWAICRKCYEGIYLSSTDGWADQIFPCEVDCKTNKDNGIYWPLENYGRVLFALNAAQKARFEHGEKG